MSNPKNFGSNNRNPCNREALSQGAGQAKRAISRTVCAPQTRRTKITMESACSEKLQTPNCRLKVYAEACDCRLVWCLKAVD